MTGFSGRSHGEEIVSAPDGSRFRVQIGRTGVHRYSPIGGGPNLTGILFTWARYLEARRTTWTVTAKAAGVMHRETFLSEEFPTRPAAAERADAVAEAIVGQRPTNGTAL